MSLICSLTWHILQRGQKSFWLAWFYSPPSKVPWLFPVKPVKAAHPQVSRRRSKGLAPQALNSDNLIGILLIRAALPMVSGLGATTVHLEPWESYSWTKHGPGHEDRPSVGRRSGGGGWGGLPSLIDFTLVTAQVRSLIICLALWKDSLVYVGLNKYYFPRPLNLAVWREGEQEKRSGVDGPTLPCAQGLLS